MATLSKNRFPDWHKVVWGLRNSVVSRVQQKFKRHIEQLSSTPNEAVDPMQVDKSVPDEVQDLSPSNIKDEECESSGDEQPASVKTLTP